MSLSRTQHLGCLVVLLALAGLAGTTDAQQTGPAPISPGSDWRAAVQQFAAEHEKHPAWGYSHCLRDYQLAKVLAAQDRVLLDDDVLYAAAYLHDVAALPPYEKPHVDHAEEAARIVGSLLSGTGFPMTKIDAVREAIRTHMFNRKPLGPEALYLHDADALDWLGAIGVARIFSLVDPAGGQPDGPAACKMLQDNLKRVPPGILSPAGRALSVRRVQELEQYLRELSSESDEFRLL
jgi:uncharacterized protein